VLLLDTHVWLWSAGGDVHRIGRRSRRLLARAEAQDGIWISAVSVFEVTALHVAGRLRLAHPVGEWIRASLQIPGVRLAELTAGAAIDAGCIPRAALADPLDRLLVASARQLDVAFLTADAHILDYASRTGDSRVYDASA
jgi:PIN domain nuclease of toxin-antitoxin system